MIVSPEGNGTTSMSSDVSTAVIVNEIASTRVERRVRDWRNVANKRPAVHTSHSAAANKAIGPNTASRGNGVALRIAPTKATHRTPLISRPATARSSSCKKREIREMEEGGILLLRILMLAAMLRRNPQLLVD
jgi:hypothetical protein